MTENPHTSPTKARRPLGVIAALFVATVAMVLTMGTGTASAQTLESSGTLGGEVGNRFCYNLQVTGATGELSYDVTSGSLPPGVFLLSHTFGAIVSATETRWGFSGTPTQTGTFNATVTVTDDQGTPGVPGDDTTDVVAFDFDIVAQGGADVVVHAGRLGIGYTIDCQAAGREAQGFLRDIDNFGSGGTVTERLEIRNHTPFDSATDTGEPITAAQLSTVDILLDGWVWDGTWTPAEIRDLGTWVNGGGVLIAAEDRSVADTLGQMFGAPTQTNILCDHTPSEQGDPTATCPEMSSADDTHPIVDGAFGDWSADSLNTSGSVGHFGASAPAGWDEVVEWDSDGNAAVITRAVGNGRVVLLNDEALWRTQSFPTFSNQVFVGNLMEFAIASINEGGGAITAPVLADDSYTVDSGVAFSENPCGNDTDTTGTDVSVFVDTPLPSGVTLATGGATCTLSGTATESFDVAYQRTIAGETSWAVISVEVTPPDLQPDLTNDSFTGVVGEAFDESLCDNDAELGEAPRTVAIVGGSLPGGLALVDCDVVGTPTTAGSFSATYRVTDDDGDTDTATVAITITEDAVPPPAPVYRCKGEIATLVGTMGDDVIVGTPARDVIVARGGNDTIRGRGGNDLICAGGGDDRVFGGSGADRMYGQGGADLIKGGGGADRAFGGAGADRLAGNSGQVDRCIGGPGVDRFLNGCERRRQ